MKLAICVLALSFTSNAFAAGAAYWSCVSNKAGLTASYEASLFGEILVTTQRHQNRVSVETLYFYEDGSSLTNGEKPFYEDDPTQSEFQQLEGSVASTLHEIEVPDSRKSEIDFGFWFQGNFFYCARQFGSRIVERPADVESLLRVEIGIPSWIPTIDE